MAIRAFTASGSKATTAPKASPAVFGVEAINHELIKAAYVAYLANGRENLAVSKTRGDVSGGGKKPWRQKGTGRARFGSSRVPIWRGGGITHGPTGLENYSHAISTADKRGALRHALSAKVSADALVVIEKLTVKEGRTKEAAALFNTIGATRNTLVVTDAQDDLFTRAVRNVSNVKLVRARAVNIFDVMNADMVVMTSGALAEVNEWLGGKS